MRMKGESEKTDLKFNIQKNKVLSFVPLLHGTQKEKMEALTDFIFLGSKSLQMVTAAMNSKDICFLEGKL